MEPSIIQSKIYEIRGQRVMLDFDLAELYQVETKALKQSVKRNMDRFEGEDFMFELSNNELKQLIISSRSQIVTLNGRGQNFKYQPLAFTELGVAMLSSVLRSNIAIDVNRNIMRAFVAMRRYLTGTAASSGDITRIDQEIRNLKQYIEEVFSDYNDINEDTAMQLELINQTLAELSAKQTAKEEQTSRPKIGFRK